MAKKIGIVNLFGYISSWNDNSAQNFTRRFNDAVSDSESIDLHIHCYGGDVFEGNLIYNLIRKSPIPVDVYIDGISASMASIIMLAGRKLYMSENAFIMIHAPKGWIDGTADDFTRAAKLLGSMEKTFVKTYASRTGKATEDVSKWLVGDNWFSAEDALAEKLIDAIVDPIDTTVEQLPAEELKQYNAQTLFNKYTAISNTVNNHKPNSENEMNKQSLIARFGLTGVTAESSDAEIELAIQAKLDAEKTARVNAETALAKQKQDAVTACVTAAVGSGKITESQRKTFESIGETSGIEALQTALDAIKPVKSIVSQLGGASGVSGAGVTRADWDFDRWQKEDPSGLEKLPYDEFNALYKAKFNVEAPK